MKRSFKKPIKKSVKFDRSLEPIVISKITLDLLLKCKKPSDCIALYIFYYYTAKWQKTNTPLATTGYVQKGLNWGEVKVQKTKAELRLLGLIEDVKNKDEKTGKILGWYIQVNFIWSHEGLDKITNINHPLESTGVVPETTPWKNHPVANPRGNALSTNNLNALSTGILPSHPPLNGKSIHGKIKPSHFNKLYKIYPRKASAGQAEISFLKLCSKPIKDRPTFKEVLQAIKAQSKTKQWENKKYIPHFSTWCNQSRWKDEIEPMNEIWDKKDSPGKVSNASGAKLDFSQREPDEVIE